MTAGVPGTTQQMATSERVDDLPGGIEVLAEPAARSPRAPEVEATERANTGWVPTRLSPHSQRSPMSAGGDPGWHRRTSPLSAGSAAARRARQEDSLSQFPPQPPPAGPDWGQPAPGGAPPGPDYAPQPGYGPQPAAQPEYGQPPGYGQQPGYGPGGPGAPGGYPPAKRSSPVVAVLLIVAVVAVAGAGIYFLTSRGDDSGPAAAVESYFDAAIDGDCDAMVDLVAREDGLAAEFAGECPAFLADDIPDGVAAEIPAELLSTSVEDETDDTATVEVEYRNRGGEIVTEDMPMVREDGDWKVGV